MISMKPRFLPVITLLVAGFTWMDSTVLKEKAGSPTSVTIPNCYLFTIKYMPNVPFSCVANTLFCTSIAENKPVYSITPGVYSVECEDAGIILCCAQLKTNPIRTCYNQLFSTITNGTGSVTTGYVYIDRIYCKMPY